MRILHVVNNVTRAGNGISNVAVDLAVEQSRQGHDVAVASAGGSEDSTFVGLLTDEGVRHHVVDFRIRTPGRVVRAHRDLVRVLDEVGPDVVHVHTLTPTVLAYLGTRRRRIPVVATVHNEYQRGVRLMGLADAVVGVSNAVSESMARRGIPRRRIHTVLNGTVGSPRRPTLRPDQVLSLPPKSVVTVGAVSHRKGADVLVEAFGSVVQRHPEAHLFLVGHVDWAELPDRLRGQPWADRVHFVGFDPQPQRYLPGATVFVLASRRDPMPLVLLEALEVGLPIVASDVDGIPEALLGGTVGHLARVGDVDDFAAKISQLLDSEDERQRLSLAARARGAALTVSAMTTGYLGIYRALAAR
ncbi:Glycosyltransferase involved in cell wall bisynthesis [Geodermatophilus saharensis]|uniref:Glycosyltransferase involved in cell wall bisynthesis n=1 Tax=Geodermatophilus saharensis TaxID=1137994 RepID=A0A239I9Y0_9ACTN|nr:glycosyltransferase family 4 protein [Geodermatophilus saharensis]SNS90321.1 Glycosyltransferase involved in cell wall bisynthesis [Geodermatophilus saharensis]